MTDPVPSKKQFSAVKEFDEWNDVTGAIPRGIGWYYECRSIVEDADKELERLERELGAVKARAAEMRDKYLALLEERAAPEPSAMRALWNKAVIVQDDNRATVAFETADEAEAAFDYLHELGNIQPAAEPPPALTEEEMPEPSLDVLKRVAARMRVNAPDTAFLAEWAAERIEELEATFDLRWKADMRAIKRWQEAHPGNDLTWPDHADMVVWMLDQMDARASQPPRDGQ